VQYAEELEGSVNSKRIMTDTELIDIFASTLDKIWKTYPNIETALPNDILQMIETKSSSKTQSKIAIFLSHATYESQSSQSFVNNSIVSFAQNRTPAELVEIMASRLCDIKESHP
jgi:hypothetical protein